jgi:hypothetical protein
MRVGGGFLVSSGGWAGICEPATQPVAPPGATNYAALDLFSLVHALGGMAFGVLGLSLTQTMVAAALWEVAEYLLKNVCPAAFFHPTQDTLANAVGDLVFAALGWWAGRGLRLGSSAGLADRRGR